MADKLAAVSRQLNALADRLEADGLQEPNQQRRARIAYDYSVEAGRCLVEAWTLGAFDREAPFVVKARSSKQQDIPTDVASLVQSALRDDHDEKANFNDVFCSLWRHWLPTKDDKFEYRRFQRPRLDLTYANYMRVFAEIFNPAATSQRHDNPKSDWPILVPQDLRKLFHIEQDTLLKRLKSQEIPNEFINSKAYRVNPNCLPNRWETTIGRTPKN